MNFAGKLPKFNDESDVEMGNQMTIGLFDILLPIRVAKSLDELEVLSEGRRAVIRHAIKDHVGRR